MNDKTYSNADYGIYAFIAAALVTAVMMAGCANTTKKEYYETGQLKSEYSETGFDPKWSDGVGKVMPLGQISVNGVGGNAGGVVK